MPFFDRRARALEIPVTRRIQRASWVSLITSGTRRRRYALASPRNASRCRADLGSNVGITPAPEKVMIQPMPTWRAQKMYTGKTKMAVHAALITTFTSW
jgi:hypothetical protein